MENKFTHLNEQELLVRANAVAAHPTLVRSPRHQTHLSGLDAPDADDWWMLVRALHQHASANVFMAAVAWCTSNAPLAQQLGADTLAQLGIEPKPFRDASLVVLRPLLTSADASVVVAAIQAMGHLVPDDEDLPELERCAGHAAPDVRLAVAVALGGVDGDHAHQILLDLMTDADDDVRNWATFGIGMQSDRDTIAIRDALSDRLDDEHDETWCEAVLGLARRRVPEVIEIIAAELTERSALPRMIQAASFAADNRLLPALKSVRSDVDGMDRRNLEWAIDCCESETPSDV